MTYRISLLFSFCAALIGFIVCIEPFASSHASEEFLRLEHKIIERSKLNSVPLSNEQMQSLVKRLGKLKMHNAMRFTSGETSNAKQKIRPTENGPYGDSTNALDPIAHEVSKWETDFKSSLSL